ncbi:hypothetical protein GJ744_008038 [Endocarpon pusillum]|uniref:Uncharacterized protein n=1 Tax=Endocarpon pusillum TaxID=364733 RepID=A0A8H7AI09_9EURO|nr:hypothetical protein GJ744_008038 [Endocarpon pusillum]
MPVFGRGPNFKASKQHLASSTLERDSRTASTATASTDQTPHAPQCRPSRIPGPPREAQSDRCDECGRDVQRGEQCELCKKHAWARLQSNMASPPRRRGAALNHGLASSPSLSHGTPSSGPSNTLVAPSQSGQAELSNKQQQQDDSYKDLLGYLKREHPQKSRRNVEDLKPRFQKPRSPTKPRVTPSSDQRNEEHKEDEERHGDLEDVLMKSIREAEARMEKGSFSPR